MGSIIKFRLKNGNVLTDSFFAFAHLQKAPITSLENSQSSVYGRKYYHLFKLNILIAHIRKNTHYWILLVNQISGKYLEPRKELTRFAWSEPLQKCWTGVTIGKNWQTLSFGEFFSSWNGNRFVFKFVLSKVLHQHMLLFLIN